MTSRRRIITPAEAIARARIRPRNAPRVRMHAGMEGRIRWGLIDRSGREVRGGEQHNLLLDSFLDYIATSTHPVGFTGYNWTTNLIQESFDYCAVGTGSAEPDVTDTALGSEVARTGTALGTTNARTSNGVYEVSDTYEFDFAEANGNLTEWGMAPESTGGLHVRELFRDEVGDPVTVTKTSDYKLRVVYTFTVTLTPTTLTPGSFAITNIGTINGDYLWMGGKSAAIGADLMTFAAVAAGSLVTSIGAFGSTIGTGYPTKYPSAYTYLAKYDGRFSHAGSCTVAPYTGGTYERTVTEVEMGTADGNQEWKDITVFRASPVSTYKRGAFVFAIDAGDRFTKDDLHILTIDNPITVSWGRQGSGS